MRIQLISNNKELQNFMGYMISYFETWSALMQTNYDLRLVGVLSVKHFLLTFCQPYVDDCLHVNACNSRDLRSQWTMTFVAIKLWILFIYLFEVTTSTQASENTIWHALNSQTLKFTVEIMAIWDRNIWIYCRILSKFLCWYTNLVSLPTSSIANDSWLGVKQWQA